MQWLLQSTTAARAYSASLADVDAGYRFPSSGKFIPRHIAQRFGCIDLGA